MLDAILLFRDALYGALVIALVCSALGVYVVLRRIVFVGASLAQLSTLGIAISFWLAGLGVGGIITSKPVFLSLFATLLGVVFFSTGMRRARIPPDARIGVAYVVAGALAILFIAKATVGEAHDIFLQGNILGITRSDWLVLLGVSVPVLLVHALFYKEFLFISFDQETARTLGYRVERWTLLLYLTLGLSIAFAMQFAGLMLVFDFLVLPAVTGLLMARGMGGVFTWGIGAGLAAAVIGFSISVPFDLPTGPAIVAVSGALVILAWLTRRLRDVR
ncbi:MAG TPA: metal ABC transporter permease [Gemmatimonadaceae bacterium]|nr:metal ABC transporter permease [Gemmatimonadaceae bacterium]